MLKIDGVILPSNDQWMAAIVGMRHPKLSYDKIDTEVYKKDGEFLLESSEIIIGNNDLSLMKRLANAGTDHRKFMRMIPVYMNITAPLYWWKEFDTYKVGTVANSTSTMHKITDKKFSIDDFSNEHISLRDTYKLLQDTVDILNNLRRIYIEGGVWTRQNGDLKVFAPKDKEIWYQLIQLLPSSYNQTRMVFLNYEVLRNMYHSRKNHKLDEWHIFCDKVKSLPYSGLITEEWED